MEYVELILVTYYVVVALTRTDGPRGVFYRLRQHQSLPFYCAVCLAPYAAVTALLVAVYAPDWITTVLAVAGAVVALHDLIERMRELV